MEVHPLGRRIGGMLAVAGIINAFVSFLLLLGVIIPPIAAIYVIDALRSRPTQTPVHWPAIATWLASASIAMLANSGYFTLTTVPALDATLAATLIYWIWSRRFHSIHRGEPVMPKKILFALALISLASTGGAHQIWLERGAGEVVRVYLGEAEIAPDRGEHVAGLASTTQVFATDRTQASRSRRRTITSRLV